MKNTRKLLSLGICYLLMICSACGPSNNHLSKIETTIDVDSLLVSEMQASFVYDTNNMQEAVEHEIIPIERERFVSTYDANQA